MRFTQPFRAKSVPQCGLIHCTGSYGYISPNRRDCPLPELSPPLFHSTLNHKCDAFQELPMTRAGIMSSTPLDSPATSPGTMCSPTEPVKGLSSTLTCSGIGSGEGSQPRTLIPRN